ncbi:hypothetical protein SH139x_002122 [Planctomycetaceae bacterium SH139]
MNRFLSIVSVAFICAGLTGCPYPSGGIQTDNQNEPAGLFSNDDLIRVWVLSEAQIANPPATKSEAAAIENFVTRPSEEFRFLRDPGSYFVVASNETQFQSLGDEDSFTLGVDFSVLPVDVADELISVALVNDNSSPTLLPIITEL